MVFVTYGKKYKTYEKTQKTYNKSCKGKKSLTSSKRTKQKYFFEFYSKKREIAVLLLIPNFLLFQIQLNIYAKSPFQLIGPLVRFGLVVAICLLSECNDFFIIFLHIMTRF